uniref:Uncharacterized protein n=1 Tax=Knipowitschia caucasica TaxID=637954 RepID=A0AAV2K676_KNICA
MFQVFCFLRFSQLQDFSLCHWIRNVNHAVEVTSRRCLHLRSLKLSHCSGLTKPAWDSLGLHCRSLQRLDLQYSEKGCCPNLELLEINRKLDSNLRELNVCVQGLQMACPKLKTFRIMNVIPINRTMRGVESCGFPRLEELSLATTSCCYISDADLLHFLLGSTKLRVLDLRGCNRVTPAGLAALPCPDLQCLFWGQYYNSSALTSLQPKAGLQLVTQKWGATLQQVDLANQLFTEDDLDSALSFLSQTPHTLHSLNLTGTRVTAPPLKSLLRRASSLNYLNLTSCRYLPRGLKRIYRGQADILPLLENLH